MRQGDYLQTSFCFLKILYEKKKQVVSNLVLIHCGSHSLGDAIKRTK